MKHELEVRTALELARKAGDEVARHYYGGGFETRYKADRSPVTSADLAANSIILEGLERHFPGYGVVSEESDFVQGKLQKVWYVDPIDGTKSFIKRTDHFTVMVGLAYEGKPVLGVVHKPISQETYLGIAGRGAWRIGPRGESSLLEVNRGLERMVAVVAAKKKEYDESRPALDRLGIDEYVICSGEGFRLMKIAEGFGNIRVAGSASNTWDVCAPMAILAGAGGVYAYQSLEEPVLMEGKQRVKDAVVYAATPEILWNARAALAKK